MTDTATQPERVAEEFDPYDPEYLQDPYAVFDAARAAGRVFFAPRIGYWVVTHYDDIHGVLRNSEAFSASPAIDPMRDLCPAAGQQLAEAGMVAHPFLVNEDDPGHKAHRLTLRKKLTPKEVKQLEPIAREYVVEYIERFKDRGEADLIDDMLFEVPALVALRLMGVPASEAHYAKSMAKGFTLWAFGRPSDEEQAQLAKDFVAYYQYCRDHVDKLFENPGDDYISNAIRVAKEQDRADLFPPDYLYSIMQGHLVAAHETTTNAAGNGLRALLEHPDQWRQMCEDPSLIPNVVEETLRFQSSVVAWRRKALVDVEVGGTTIPEGDGVLILLGSANHDEEHFEDGQAFDICRKNAKDHLAFGWGKHRCLGEALARMELRVIYEELTARLPNLELVPDQEWSFLPNVSFRGPQHLKVRWDVA